MSQTLPKIASPAPHYLADRMLHHMAEEQMMFLKSRCQMSAVEIITLYGGQIQGTENYQDAVEHIALFNMQVAAKNGFIAG